MKFSPRRPVLDAVAITGLGLALTSTAAASTSPGAARAFTVAGLAPATALSPARARAATAAAQAPLWVTHQDVVKGGINAQVAVSPDGTKVVVTGYNWSASPGSQPEFATVAYDSGTGAQLWAARYGQPAKEAAYGVSAAVSPDSSKIFVTGDTANDGTTVAYNS